MANVSKLNLYGTDYNIKDATARNNLTTQAQTMQIMQGAINTNTTNISALQGGVENLEQNTVVVAYTAASETISFTKGVAVSVSEED